MDSVQQDSVKPYNPYQAELSFFCGIRYYVGELLEMREMTDDTQNKETDQQQTGVTLEQLQQLLGGFKEEISKMVTGAVQKSHRSLEGKLSDTVQSQLTTVLDKVTQATATGGEGQEVTQESNDDDGVQSAEDPVTKFQAMLQAQAQQMEKRLSETEQQYEQRIKAMQDAVDQERLNTAMLTARNSVLDPLRDQLHNPDSFWSDIERQGITYDSEKGGYGIVGKDEFQNPTWTPLTEKLPDLQKSLAYQFKPRPGNGTGTQPGRTNSTTTSSSAYSNQSKVPADTRFDVLKKSSDPLADIVSGLEQTVG